MLSTTSSSSVLIFVIKIYNYNLYPAAQNSHWHAKECLRKLDNLSMRSQNGSPTMYYAVNACLHSLIPPTQAHVSISLHMYADQNLTLISPFPPCGDIMNNSCSLLSSQGSLSLITLVVETIFGTCLVNCLLIVTAAVLEQMGDFECTY
jgi:hypothetical protein